MIARLHSSISRTDAPRETWADLTARERLDLVHFSGLTSEEIASRYNVERSAIFLWTQKEETPCDAVARYEEGGEDPRAAR